jgi:hypothetical protein
MKNYHLLLFVFRNLQEIFRLAWKLGTWYWRFPLCVK